MSDRFAVVPAAVLEDDTLDTYSKMILVALRLHADREGRAFPSLATLARLSGMGKSTIVRKLSELECSGHLRRSKKRLPSGEWAQTEYELLPHPYPREEQEVVSQRDKGCPRAGQGVVPERDKGCPAASRGLSHSGTLTVPDNIKSMEQAGSTEISKPLEAPEEKQPESRGSDQPDLYGATVQKWNSAMVEHGGLPPHTPSKAHRENFFARVRASPEREKLGWWRALLNYVLASDFLCGRVEAKQGKRPFKVSFEWIIADEARLSKILNGQYHDVLPERFVAVKEKTCEKEVPSQNA